MQPKTFFNWFRWRPVIDIEIKQSGERSGNRVFTQTKYHPTGYLLSRKCTKYLSSGAADGLLSLSSYANWQEAELTISYYILCSQRWSSIQSAKTRLGADCGSDHELLISKFRLKLQKVGKTTRPFRYDLNLIPWICLSLPLYNHKGFDLGHTWMV